MEKKLSENCGVYCIKNLVNNKIYIGSSKHIKRRRLEHFNDLIANRHHNEYLQKSFNKYGKENFIFEIIELCEEKDLLIIEQKYIDLYYDNNIKCYNMCNKAGKCPDNSGKNNGMYGKIPWNKGLCGEYSTVYGRHRTLDEKIAISLKNSGKNNGMYGKIPANAKKVRCVEENIIFNSLREAGDWINKIGIKNGGHLGYLLRNNKNEYKGYHWEYVK